MENSDLKQIWKQRLIPVVLRRTGKGERLRIRIPIADRHGNWLRNGRRAEPDWIESGQYWELPKAWFNDFVDRALAEFGKVYIVQPYRELEKCSPSCLNAVGHECECSCMGANHGTGDDGTWFEVSDAFAFRFGEQMLASRLLTRRLA